MTPTRRSVLSAALAAPLAAPLAPSTATPSRARASRLDPDVADLERVHGVRIGFVALDPTTGRSISHRADDRFPVLSVFKVLAAAAVLRDLDRCGEVLARVVRYTADDLVDYSPVTEQHVAEGMSVGALCDAALRFSDNTAGNLLLAELGGPGAVTRFARSLGDPTTRLDRWETALNEATPGDPRDTTSARACVRFLERLLVGRALEPRDQVRLRGWMLANTTSGERFRRDLPPGWTLADKTGSGERGTANDVGVLWSPEGRPLVLAGLTRTDDAAGSGRSEPLAALAALAIDRLSH